VTVAARPEWSAVIQAIVAACEGDAELTNLLGGSHIYRTHDTRDVRIPSITWQIISNVPGENTRTIDVQLDLWARGIGAMEGIEARVLDLFDHRVVATVSGLRMWSMETENRDIADPEAGVIHRAYRFEFQPIRRRR
jgi:hypothetical protein